MPRSPVEEAIAGPMPPYDGLGLHDDEDFCPPRPDAPKSHPEDTIGGSDARAVLLDHRGELLPKGEVLQQELPPRTKERSDRPDAHRYKAKHGPARLPGSSETVNDFRANGIMANDRPRATF